MKKIKIVFAMILISMVCVINIKAQETYAVHSIELEVLNAKYFQVNKTLVPCKDALSISKNSIEEYKKRDVKHGNDVLTNDNIDSNLRVGIWRDRWFGRNTIRGGVKDAEQSESILNYITRKDDFYINNYRHTGWNNHIEKLFFGFDLEEELSKSSSNDTTEVFKYTFAFPPIAYVNYTVERDSLFLYIKADEYKGSCLTPDSTYYLHMTGHLCDPRKPGCQN